MKWRTLLLLLTVGLVALALGYDALPRRAPVIHESESAFGRIRVTERPDGLRSLYLGEGRALQTALYPGRPLQLVSAYTRVATIALALAPEDGRILYVGLGGGAMPMHAREVLPRARIDVVEIDPAVIDVAIRFFAVRPDSLLTVHAADGRAFIETTPPGSYDVIVLDAFSDDEVPFALTTRQFLEAVRTALAPDGVVVSNLWSAQSAYTAMLATYDVVFDQVHLLRVPRRAQRILVASADRALDRDVLVDAAGELDRRASLGFDVADLVADGYERLPRLPAKPLDDDHRP